jgi:hypothetical protein
MSDSMDDLYKIVVVNAVPTLFEQEEGGWEEEDLEDNESLDVVAGGYELRETYTSSAGVWTEVKVLSLTPSPDDNGDIYFVSDKYYIDPLGNRVEDDGDEDDDDDDIGGSGDDLCDGEDGARTWLRAAAATISSSTVLIQVMTTTSVRPAKTASPMPVLRGPST